MKPKKQTDDDDMDDIQLPPSGMNMDELTEKIILAKYENIVARTKAISEKTTSIKRELFSQWTDSFMSAFEDAFAIFKNSIINLHLDEAKTKQLQSEFEEGIKKLEKALKKIVKTAKIEEEE